MPYQNVGRKSDHDNVSMGKAADDNDVCRKILESDAAIRVAAFIEDAEVTGYAKAARTKNVLSQSSDLRKQVGGWVRVVTEIARQTDKMFGSTECICITHKGLKMATVPLSQGRSLGLSLDRSADVDYLILKIMTKFDLITSDH